MKARNAFEDDRRKALGDGEVVGGAERIGAEIVEGEPGDAARRSRDDERAPLYGKGRAVAGRPVGQFGKGVLQSVMRRLLERVMVDRLAVQPASR